MVKTFRAIYAKDRAADPAEDIADLRANLLKQGFIPQGLTDDANNWIFSGNVDCRCKDKHDKAYCDGEDNCNNDYKGSR